MTKINFLLLSSPILLFIHLGNSAKILFLIPTSSKSHQLVFEPLLMELAKRNHEIVLISPYKPMNLPTNIESIIAAPHEKVYGKMPNPFEVRKHMNSLLLLINTITLFDEACHMLYQNQRVQQLLKYDKFDLIYFDAYSNCCALGILEHFNVPYIYISPVPASNRILELIGSHQPPSFVPFTLIKYTDRMNFFERFINTMIQWIFISFNKIILVPRAEKIYRKYLGEDFSSVTKIDENVSMIFMNSHFTMTYPRPLLPDIVEVGGIHIRPSQDLPKDLENFIAGAEDGFILFSLGSITQGSEMPEENRQVFLNVFSKLKQRVLWKWETEIMEGLPSNVMIKKFLPQQDILGHPNIRMFITHGGLLSTQEGLYHGIPMIIIPLFGDQDINAQRAKNAGYSLTLEIIDMKEETLSNTISTILHEQRFKQIAKQQSKLFRDTPETPLERAVFWSEYVIRHKGAFHMRSGARELNILQFHSLDIFAFLIFLNLIILYVFIILIKKLKLKMFSSSGLEIKEKKRKLHSKKLK